MARDLPLSNGNLLVNFDLDYNVRDIYYPYVGEENHTLRCVSRTGVWVGGRFSWLSDPAWKKTMLYEQDTLVTEVVAVNEELGLTLSFHDIVCHDHDIFLRQVGISNQDSSPREVRLFFHYAFRMMGTEQSGTLYYHPHLKGLVAYQNQRYFLLSGASGTGVGPSGWTVGTRDDGPWRDAEDGRLEQAPISWGSTGGVISIRSPAVPAGGEATAYHWLAASTRFHGVEDLDALVRQAGPARLIQATRVYWRAWLRKEHPGFERLPEEVGELYKRSLLLMQCHADNRGAIIAGADSDVIDVLHDSYTHVWGRDGAFIAEALDLAGHRAVTHRYFDFLNSVITGEGYLLHKYNPDGCLSTHWIPWADTRGNLLLPIQEDSTALTVRSLWAHYRRFRDLELISDYYPRLIRAAGTFLAEYRDQTTGLPAMSWDLWEMRRGIHTFTVAAVWAGLRAAANFADLFGDAELRDSFRRAADEIKSAMLIYLVDKERGCFPRSVAVDDEGSLVPDRTPDIATCAPLLFGMFGPSEPLVESTVRSLREALWCDTSIGGLARFAGDEFFRQEGTGDDVPGNPWVISTMWMARYRIAMARHQEDLGEALGMLRWAVARALPSGVLAEQLEPDTGVPVNMSPLAWSHAEVVITVHEYLRKLNSLRSRR